MYTIVAVYEDDADGIVEAQVLGFTNSPSVPPEIDTQFCTVFVLDTGYAEIDADSPHGLTPAPSYKENR